MKTSLEQLEHWIAQYKRINGSPPIEKVLIQIQFLKDYEKEQINIIDVGDLVCCPCSPNTDMYTESTIKCKKCNKEVKTLRT